MCLKHCQTAGKNPPFLIAFPSGVITGNEATLGLSIVLDPVMEHNMSVQHLQGTAPSKCKLTQTRRKRQVFSLPQSCMSFCQANVDLCLFALLPYGSGEKGVEGESVAFLFKEGLKELPSGTKLQ